MLSQRVNDFRFIIWTIKTTWPNRLKKKEPITVWEAAAFNRISGSRGFTICNCKTQIKLINVLVYKIFFNIFIILQSNILCHCLLFLGANHNYNSNFRQFLAKSVIANVDINRFSYFLVTYYVMWRIYIICCVYCSRTLYVIITMLCEIFARWGGWDKIIETYS